MLLFWGTMKLEIPIFLNWINDGKLNSLKFSMAVFVQGQVDPWLSTIRNISRFRCGKTDVCEAPEQFCKGDTVDAVCRNCIDFLLRCFKNGLHINNCTKVCSEKLLLTTKDSVSSTVDLANITSPAPTEPHSSQAGIIVPLVIAIIILLVVLILFVALRKKWKLRKNVLPRKSETELKEVISGNDQRNDYTSNLNDNTMQNGRPKSRNRTFGDKSDDAVGLVNGSIDRSRQGQTKSNVLTAGTKLKQPAGNNKDNIKGPQPSLESSNQNDASIPCTMLEDADRQEHKHCHSNKKTVTAELHDPPFPPLQETPTMSVNSHDLFASGPDTVSNNMHVKKRVVSSGQATQNTVENCSSSVVNTGSMEDNLGKGKDPFPVQETAVYEPDLDNRTSNQDQTNAEREPLLQNHPDGDCKCGRVDVRKNGQKSCVLQDETGYSEHSRQSQCQGPSHVRAEMDESLPAPAMNQFSGLHGDSLSRSTDTGYNTNTNH